MNGREKFLLYKNRNGQFYAAEIMSTPYLLDRRIALTGEGTFHMILTHIVQKDEQYAEYYRNEKGLKLLDNSLFELGYALPPEQVIEAAKIVNADILVSPDVIRDGEKTLQNAINFTNSLKELGMLDKYAVMAVPQGSSVMEWVECYQQLTAIEGIDCIGLSIIGMITSMQDVTGTDDIVVNRQAFMKLMSEQQLWNKNIWHHLLGLGRGPFELEAYKDMYFVRSNDSSNAWWHGVNQIKYNPRGQLDKKLKLEVDFAQPVLKFSLDDVVYNLSEQREIVEEINEARGVY
jgi:hypothetical protein